jgi:hypothetical protein
VTTCGGRRAIRARIRRARPTEGRSSTPVRPLGYVAITRSSFTRTLVQDSPGRFISRPGDRYVRVTS